MARVTPHIIGIAGGTASGKTTLTQRLLALAGPAESTCIELDGYYKSQDHKSPEERAKNNYDHPDAFEFELLGKHLQELKLGKEVEIPVYDFTIHNRLVEQTKAVENKRFIFVEGILTLTIPEIAAQFDSQLFVYAPDPVRLERRLARDVKERGRSSSCVLEQWVSTVNPMHQKYCAPCQGLADMVVDGTDLSDSSIRKIWYWIQTRAA